ncbi:hypothetical protein KIF53_15570 [Chromobacterium subtsugae]|uniref:Uncharacterized protein n=1 Tax=Chromobacterium subtsugae TaxID=251747 RepID=A0ABS7FG46_9NEIS|nr:MULTISPECIES: hypothetical protein [Chromobacterium]MBW7567825.1 hypothetical protein [Chromobacterium subtsugae]MBW8289052.1 hypothetical protein [Chromobacterium subtsugae]WSE93804.1 hypothetical protein U6115_11330 [Chromobacterium subtsugae]WVH62181.1 hypothetical protein U6151_11350 [Chromobacterium subtsugae]
MGIKMDEAYDSDRKPWKASDYEKGKGTEPLSCIHCPAEITHNLAHFREYHDKSVLVPSYFKLKPGRKHEIGCQFGITKEVEIIADKSEGLIEALKGGKRRLRLAMLKEAIQTPEELTAPPKSKKDEDEGTDKISKKYVSSGKNISAYINTAKRVLEVAAQCEEDLDMADELELVFEGTTVVEWKKFYFNAIRQLEAYETVRNNTKQHPIAICGTIASIKSTSKGKVINLEKSKAIKCPDLPDNCINIEISIFLKDSSWADGFSEGDEIIAFGMWTRSPDQNGRIEKPIKYKTITTRKLNLNPQLKGQIFKIQRR